MLWASKVYKDASPRLLEAMRERARQKEDEVERQRSRSIDQGLKRDAREAANTVRVLLVSTAAELGPTFMKALRSYRLSFESDGLPYSELVGLRPTIRQAAASLMVQAAELALGADTMPPAVDEAAIHLLASKNSDLLSPRAAESLRRLWEDTGFQQERSRAETDGSGFPSSAD